MKSFLLFLLISCFTEWLAAQNFFSDTELRNVDGKIVKSGEIFNHNHPVVLIFWKSYDTKCCDNLENMQSAWLSQLKDKGVRLIAVCVDCNGTWNYVKPIVYGKAWEFDVYIDVNGDFKRFMGIADVPCTLLLDKNRKIICRSQGYCTGNEEFVCEKILQCIEVTEGNSGLQANAQK